jgi:hypothetical protein
MKPFCRVDANEWAIVPLQVGDELCHLRRGDLGQEIGSEDCRIDRFRFEESFERLFRRHRLRLHRLDENQGGDRHRNGGMKC